MKFYLFILIILISQPLFSNDEEEYLFSKEALEKIREEIKSDKLLEFKKKKEEKIVVQKKIQQNMDKDKFSYPRKEHFLGFLSELWLVKNASVLKWDFKHPEYGIEEAFSNLLQDLGIFGKKIKILVLDSSFIFHGAIPLYDSNAFIISLPFMRTLDLSRQEISLLLLENLIRIEQGIFEENLKLDFSLASTNFEKEGINLKFIENALKRYTEVLSKEGFSYKQQFDVTKKMELYLKPIPKLFKQYTELLLKIDSLIKKNNLYKDYLKIYPSPELQINWLIPKKII